MPASVIKLDKVSVVYDKGLPSEMVSLREISLEIYPEEYVIFFGPSGCGKSTLLYTIAGLEVPDSGTVNVFDRDLASLSQPEFVNYHRQRVGMVFQAFYLIPSLSVLDNVILPQMFKREPPSLRKERGMEVLKRFEIAHLADRLPTELSGGQQQRVAICRSVINDPPLLFADEPVGNLDSKSSDKVMDLLHELNTKDKKTVILVTHDSRFLHYAHRVFYLKDGQLVREVLNPERSQVREEKVKPFMAHALAEFARYYPHLEEGALKAKFLSHHLLRIRDEEVQERLEHLIQQYFSGAISKPVFVMEADRSFEAGGAGLYSQTASDFANELDTFVRGSTQLHQTFDNFPKSYEVLRSGVNHAREMILQGYKGHLTAEQTDRLDSLIKARLEGTLDHKEFRRLLHETWAAGGLGLHVPTANAFSMRIELLLVNYQRSEARKEDDDGFDDEGLAAEPIVASAASPAAKSAPVNKKSV